MPSTFLSFHIPPWNFVYLFTLQQNASEFGTFGGAAAFHSGVWIPPENVTGVLVTVRQHTQMCCWVRILSEEDSQSQCWEVSSSRTKTNDILSKFAKFFQFKSTRTGLLPEQACWILPFLLPTRITPKNWSLDQKFRIQKFWFFEQLI